MEFDETAETVDICSAVYSWTYSVQTFMLPAVVSASRRLPRIPACARETLSPHMSLPVNVMQSDPHHADCACFFLKINITRRCSPNFFQNIISIIPFYPAKMGSSAEGSDEMTVLITGFAVRSSRPLPTDTPHRTPTYKWAPPPGNVDGARNNLPS